MNRLLDRVWFVEAPATRPAVLRVLLGAYTLWYVGSRYRLFLRIAGSDPTLFRPVGVVAGLRRPLPVPVFRRLLVATLLANVAFLLGWKHRWTGPLFSGSLLCVLTYRNSWSMIYHSDNALVLHALILGFAPSADALSLDARGRAAAGPVDPSAAAAWLGGGGRARWEYGWPVRLMNVATALTYFVAGVAKVVGPLGWGWARGEALRGQVAVDGLRKELLGACASRLAYRLHDKLPVYRAMGLGSLALELAAPAALADRRLARAWAVGTCSMHWGILLVMGIKFRYQLSGLIFAPLFEVERIVAVLGHPRPGAGGRRSWPEFPPQGDDWTGPTFPPTGHPPSVRRPLPSDQESCASPLGPRRTDHRGRRSAARPP
jgi:hypothetical protein